MDPEQPASFNHRTEKLSTGRTYHFIDQLPQHYDHRTTIAILCVHGFPDLWYGWRYQIKRWVDRGWRVVVPDMLGYGGTDKPLDASEYTTRKICTDLASLLDLLQINKAAVAGHDWGAFISARFALWYPERLFSLIVMSVPYTPPSQHYMAVEEVARLAPNLGYQVDFSNEATTKLIESNLRRFLQLSFQPPDQKEGNYFKQGSLEGVLRNKNDCHLSVLSPTEFQYYFQELSQGMNGPLNYYRTAEYRYQEEKEVNLPSSLSPNLPVLFLWGMKDPTTTESSISKANKFIPQITNVAYRDAGHWLLVEVKEEVTETVASWITECKCEPVLSSKL